MIETLLLIGTLVPALLTLLNRCAKTWVFTSAMRAPREDLGPGPDGSDSRRYEPRVAIHLAVSNEDPEVVLASVARLQHLEYGNFHVLVIDNNTRDPALWKPVEAYCRGRERLRFLHVESLEGYKAGALAYALERTPPSSEIIAVVDADTLVEPDMLRVSVAPFRSPAIAAVQSPLGFVTPPGELRFERWIYLIYRYFLSYYMPAAEAHDLVPILGAMALVRRSAWKRSEAGTDAI